jgi:hexosaminidase
MIKVSKLVLPLALMFASIATDAVAQNDPNMGIIPAPVSAKKSKGEFKLSPETIILVDSPQSKAVKFLAEYMRKAGYGGGIVDINTVDKNLRPTKNVINLMVNFKGDMPYEGYTLDVTEDHVNIKGRGAGLFYGIQSFIQLVTPKNPGYASVICGSIKDNPRFGYRGMHLDVSRHFFDVDFVKHYLDLMAMYKLNTFQWHLTDDQGWRIEIKKYPKLTEVGSKRAQTKVGRAGADSLGYDNTPVEGFYTQDQVRDIVQYAQDRYITVVPEIDIPGHSLAAITAYPQLSCEPSKEYKVRETWGTSSDDVICPSDDNFKMLDDILLEVMELFPAKYIHIGGDEVSMEAWKHSDYCHQLMAEKNLKDENALQNYFISRIEQFVNAQGHSIIGWDEILEGGLAPNATVMSWRGEAGGIKAAQMDHDVIMTPGTNGLYFDHAQSKSPQEPLSIGGNAPLEKVYSYDPVPAALTKDQQKHIIGVQANVWTEYIPTPAKVEYMILPRMLALAEVAWTPVAGKDYNNFSTERVPQHLARFDALGYDYRVPVPIGAKDSTMTGGKYTITLAPSVAGGKIYYTIDGYTPRETDMLYTAPLQFTVPDGKHVDLQTILITPSGKRSIVSKVRMEGK